jgi:hypothetical protein
LLVRLLRPARRLWQRWQFQLRRVEVRGLDHLRQARAAGHGVLIAPNHFAYADPFVLLEASDRARLPFYFMAAWQVFGAAGPLRRLALRQHGCFSVDREAADVRAFCLAVDILRQRPNPLVIFPEGEMYRVTGRVMPFLDGAASVALAAARGGRPIVCLPAGITYHYLEDPTPQLTRLLDRLERAMRWRPAGDRALEQRTARLTEAVVALKELEYLGEAGTGRLGDRIDHLSDAILRRLEWDYGSGRPAAGVPRRVQLLRQHVVERSRRLRADDPRQRACHGDLDDLFAVLQLYCYAAGRLSAGADLERVAAALDHLEEDVLGVPVAPPRAARAAVVTFGEPATVHPGHARKEAARALTRTLEQRVQALLDGARAGGDGPRGSANSPDPWRTCAASGSHFHRGSDHPAAT